MTTRETISVHYFASARDIAACEEELLDAVPGETVESLRRRLIDKRPALAALLPSCRVALNEDFSQESDVVRPGDSVYIMPPVSGGVGGLVGGSERGLLPRVAVVSESIAPSEATAGLQTEGAGGVVVFTGVARRYSQGRQVSLLELQAHVPLAEKELGRILSEARERYGLVDARVLHRIGRVEIGEVLVDIAVSAAHRAEAFDGCRYILDQLKERVPIWKRETDAQGESWVTPRP